MSRNEKGRIVGCQPPPPVEAGACRKKRRFRINPEPSSKLIFLELYAPN